MSNNCNLNRYRGFLGEILPENAVSVFFRKTLSKKTTGSRPFRFIVLGPLIGLDRY